ncbi:PREDICTED: transcription factor IIIA-like [Elephantulus edwardii]|uniref:transcription factor IIIA-like n=1 Tax=Elephantulus edwardii TaxID=28737 RepID=UPI0003F0A1C9|nr:PREDICTED: transcription factor IIIA-like [Elephantulus edwardii]
MSPSGHLCLLSIISLVLPTRGKTQPLSPPCSLKPPAPHDWSDEAVDNPFFYDEDTLRKQGLLVAAVLFITGIVILTSGKCRQLPQLCRNSCSYPLGSPALFNCRRMILQINIVLQIINSCALTIADAFTEASESPARALPAHVAPRRFICSFPDCSANYNKAWKLDAHPCTHTGERPFACDYEGCSKAFIREYHLSRHALTHTGEKPFVCEASGCGQKFNTQSNLKKHFERKHKNQQRQYVCDFEGCKKAFKKY